jgi:glutamate-ammonia-ligase adenylyltransferase
VGAERLITRTAARARAEAIAPGEAETARRAFVAAAKADGVNVNDEMADYATLLSCAYPALAHALLSRPDDAVFLLKSGTKTARDGRSYRRLLLPQITRWTDEAEVGRALRRFVTREKLRIATRELGNMPNAGLEVTAREMSDLADVAIDVALQHAQAVVEERFGTPLCAAGKRCPFAVIGMGKLGGRELNVGSDVDLLLIYETDDGTVERDGAPTEQTLHEHFVRVAQRMTALLETPTEDGLAFRVDLRLRPEGSRGPLVNALAAAEHYYESWGRTWERAALVRARPSAGDLAFGARALAALEPFVWRRRVDPKIAAEMANLLKRGRTEIARGPGAEPERDLKLGEGGIREAEFFVQSLQLVWGGLSPSLRTSNTMAALRRLRARGLVSEREGREVGDAYVLFRRVEHRVQFATMQQTHSLPRGELLERIARSLDYAGGAALEEALDAHRQQVSDSFASLLADAPPLTLDPALEAALDARDDAALAQILGPLFAGAWSAELSRHVLALAARPDDPLGAATRDRVPTLAPLLLEALATAADPEQAARYTATFFRRLRSSSGYARALADDPRAARRLANMFGASAFLATSVLARPELADRLLFGSGAPSVASARAALDEELAASVSASATDDAVDRADQLAGGLRRAKGRVTLEVGLADLSGEVSTRQAMDILSELADGTLARALDFAVAERGGRVKLAVIAMGALGGRAIGYGSDLDIFFVYEGEPEDEAGAVDDDLEVLAIRTAQRVLRLVGAPHGDGPGYDLDTRLRPSGNQGLLVVSRDAFARYHIGQVAGATPDSGRHADPWERQALVKARFVAGDRALGEKVIAIAERAAYDAQSYGAPDAEKLHRLRLRMEREIGRERHGSGRDRYDLKVGLGGIVDVEFAVQFLQMRHGADLRLRTGDTERALDALEAGGYLEPPLAATLRDGYRFLRQLEQRLRIVHGASVHLLEEGAPGMEELARRIGMRATARASAAEELLDRYRVTTRDVRAAYATALELRVTS